MPQLSGDSIVDWVILKVTQVCNLNCTYCYVYNRGDESWKSRPKYITIPVVEKLCDRISESCEARGLDHFTIEFHGGEPLALGRERFSEVLGVFRRRLGHIHVKYLLQTNGLLLDRDWVEWLYDNDIRFGISIDGPPSLADTRRLTLAGAGSTAKLLEVILHLREVSPRFREHNPACLCVVHPDSNGAEVVDWFHANGFRSVDFLLPDGTYDNLPEGWGGPGPYLRFMIDAFDAWRALKRPGLKIRKFETMVSSMLGIPHGLDSLGGDLTRICVVETDGGMTVSDVGRICGGKFAKDDLNIFADRLGSHASHFDLRAIQAPCSKCKACKHLVSCGGGYLPHRFDGLTFDNPSLYCDVLYGLSEHMLNVLIEEIPALGPYWYRPIGSPLDPGAILPAES